MKNAINWFEIPVKDFKRAKAFYSTIFASEITEMPHPDFKYGILPFDMEGGGIGGAIVEGASFEPSSNSGVIIYLNGGEDLNLPLAKVEKAGGKIIIPKTAIGGNGYMAHFIDTEGNKLAFHSVK